MTWWEQVLGNAGFGGGSAQGDLGSSAAADGIVIPPFNPTYQSGQDPKVYVGTDPTADEREMPRSLADGLIYKWDSNRLRFFQQQLIDAGVVRPTDVRLGVRDPKTLELWRSLIDESAIALASGVKKSPWDMLADFVEGGGIGADEDPNAPFTTEVSNPADIRRGLKDTARELTGTGVVNDSAVAGYQAKQAAADRAKYDAQNGEGGTVTAAPSFETYAIDEAKRANPVGFRAHTYLDKFSAISDMLGGS